MLPSFRVSTGDDLADSGIEVRGAGISSKKIEGPSMDTIEALMDPDGAQRRHNDLN